MLKRFGGAGLLCIAPIMALAQQVPSPSAKPTPSNTPDGLFGFMDDSTVIAAGKRKLKYQFLPSNGGGTDDWGQRLQINYGFTDNFLAGLALQYQPSNGPQANDASNTVSVLVPMQYVFVQRMQNGTGFALVTTANIGRTHNAALPGETQWSLDNHFVLDHDFDGTYFIGTNFGYTAGATDWAKSPNGTFYVQAGGTIKFSPHFYWGVQFQLSQALSSFFSNQAGWAGFVSTSVSMPINSAWTLSAAYMRQVVGGENANPSARLNTQNFSQNLGKVALAFVF